MCVGACGVWSWSCIGLCEGVGEGVCVCVFVCGLYVGMCLFRVLQKKSLGRYR